MGTSQPDMLDTSRSRRLFKGALDVSWWDITCGFVLAIAFFMLSGCGSGGYAGGGITGLSSTAVTIDASQSIPITATVTGGMTVNWSLNAGSSCMGESSGCGTISSNTGATVTYNAPASLANQIVVQLEASIYGGSSKTVTITVNPAPTITGNPPSGVVGQTYSTTLVATGGTAPLTFTLAGGSLVARVEL